MDRRRLVALATCLPLVGLAGCDAGAEEASNVEVRDSADVMVTESSAPVWSDGVGWTVAAEPAVSIGVEEGDPAYQLYRVWSALRLPEGGIVVGNSGSSEVRFYDAEGRHVRSAGGTGGGPGEFAEFSSMRLCLLPDDGLLVEDGFAGRFHRFTPAGEYLETRRLEEMANGRPPAILGCFGDGALLGVNPAGDPSLRGSPGEVIPPMEMDYLRIPPGGGDPVLLARVPDRPRYVNQVGQIIHYPYIPLMPERVVAAGRSGLWLASGGEARAERRDETGTVDQVARWSGGARRPVGEVWDRYVTGSLESIQNDNQRRQYARFYEQELPLPDSTPAVHALIVDETGSVWAERYRLPWETERVWDVLDADGRWLGPVTMPPRFTPLQIGEDFVLGRHLDELGVERVRVHRLVKNTDGGTR